MKYATKDNTGVWLSWFNVAGIACLLLSYLIATQLRFHGSYVYTHHETTGPTESIMVDGKEIYIQISSIGDPIYQKLLHSLSWRVLNCAGNEGKIVLVGSYKPGTREFLLQRWYWKGNVAIIANPEADIVDQAPVTKVKSALSYSDFDCSEPFDLKELGIN
jgi:hypothetical protein